MKRCKKRASFTLVEMISSAVIIAIGVTFMAGVLMAGQAYLQQANNKSIAMNIASYELDRQLVKSYSDLEEEMFGDDPVEYGTEVLLSEGNSTDDGVVHSYPKPYHWRVTGTTQRYGDAGYGIRIPAQVIRSQVTYTDDTINQGTVQRRINIVGKVAYPFVHIDSFALREDGDDEGLDNIRDPSDIEVPNGNYQAVNCRDDGDDCDLNHDQQGTEALGLEFKYPTGKDLLIIYNVSIDAVDADGIGKSDTIYTRCVLYRGTGGAGFNGPYYFPIETRTPIMSQPSIHNVVVIPARGTLEGTPNQDIITEDTTYRVIIQWRKDTSAGDIRIRGANIIIAAVEPRP